MGEKDVCIRGPAFTHKHTVCAQHELPSHPTHLFQTHPQPQASQACVSGDASVTTVTINWATSRISRPSKKPDTCPRGDRFCRKRPLVQK